MRTLRIFLISIILILLGGYGLLHQLSRSLRRTAMYNARVVLSNAYAEYQRTGTVPTSQSGNSFSVYTNSVIIAGINYQGALAMNWSGLSGYGIFVMTTNQTTIWLDNERGPKVIDSAYRAPYFSRGM